MSYDKQPDQIFAQKHNFKYHNIDDILKKSDIIVLSMSLNKDSENLINLENLKSAIVCSLYFYAFSKRLPPGFEPGCLECKAKAFNRLVCRVDVISPCKWISGTPGGDSSAVERSK